MDGLNGVPLEPYPGAGGEFETKPRVRPPVDNEKITINIEGEDEYVLRRMRIDKKYLDKCGFTVGCADCRAANRGSMAAGHTEECRKKIVEVGKGGRRKD